MDEGGKEGAGMIEKKYDVMAFILSLNIDVVNKYCMFNFDSRAQNRRSQKEEVRA